MEKKVLCNLLAGVVFVTGVCTLGVALKKQHDKKVKDDDAVNYLKNRELIDKNTKVLNVYTWDWFLVKVPSFLLKNEKKDSVTVVYTTRAEKASKLDFISEDKFNTEADFVEEYEQIVNFAKELNQVAPGATMVIHVESEEDVNDYIDFKDVLEKEFELVIDVKLSDQV